MSRLFLRQADTTARCKASGGEETPDRHPRRHGGRQKRSARVPAACRQPALPASGPCSEPTTLPAQPAPAGSQRRAAAQGWTKARSDHKRPLHRKKSYHQLTSCQRAPGRLLASPGEGGTQEGASSTGAVRPQGRARACGQRPWSTAATLLMWRFTPLPGPVAQVATLLHAHKTPCTWAASDF